MALHDWNHDGKKDWQDNFIEYQIYKDCTSNNSTPRIQLILIHREVGFGLY